MIDNSKCVILTPVANYIENQTDRAIFSLEMKGYHTSLMYNCSDIQYARSYLASKALADGYEELIWIDSDTGFNPDDVEKIRSHNLPFVGGVCSLKTGAGGFSITPTKSTRKIHLGVGGGLIEVEAIGFGFTYTKREVYESVKRAFNLPDCYCSRDPKTPLTPYFLPMVRQSDDGRNFLLGEDYSFNYRAKDVGYKIYADTSIRLNHIGKYDYSIEDIGGERQRFSTIVYDLNP